MEARVPGRHSPRCLGLENTPPEAHPWSKSSSLRRYCLLASLRYQQSIMHGPLLNLPGSIEVSPNKYRQR